MKHMKDIILATAFLASCLCLFWLTGNRTPWVLRDNGKEDGITAYLGDVPVQNYNRMGFTGARIAYAKKADAWLVGTDRGELLLFDRQGRQRWKRSLGSGRLVSLTVSPEGDTAYVGESSADGFYYALSVRTGDIRYRYKGADLIGTDPSNRSFPAAVHIAVDGEENQYVNFYRFLIDSAGNRSYTGRMVSLDKSGRQRWAFPEQEAIDSWINWCDVSPAGERVVLATSAYDFRPEMKYKDTLYFLDKKTGRLLDSVFIEPVPPFDNTVMRCSPNFGADGKHLAGMASDGRAFYLDDTGKVLWGRFLSKPAKVDGSWLNASGRDGYILPEGVFFTTINTFNRENWQLPTPVTHPSDNSLFAFSPEGRFLYQVRAGGTMAALAFAQGVAAVAIGRNVRTRDYKVHGAQILRLRDGKVLASFTTEGPCEAVGISADGRQMAAVEAPALTPEGRILGAYRLHLWNW
ncbi:MAG: PQQ-like beta-propeller repeat protein [Acidaminococcaceae bacterium]|nr:PQQ-like beta-propeller repeat protein [Acidaminococcaceae bacterium]